MNRRKFLSSSALVIGSLSLGNRVIADSNENFKLEILTDKPDIAIKLVDEFIQELSYSGIVKFREYEFSNEAFGDIVYINNGKLIDFKSGETHKELQEISNELKLPRKIINPVKLSFSSGSFTGRAQKFIVLKNGLVIDEILSSESTIRKIEAESGLNIIEVKNNTVKMISSSCTHKNCIKSGVIQNAGDEIICIPNKIRIVAA